MYTDVMNSEAWKAMTKPIGAKVLLLEMKALYNRKTETAVPMSVRYAAKLLGIHTQLAGQCLDALEHYGFIKETKRGYLGVDGCGFLRSAGPRGFTAYDADGHPLGLFAEKQAAVEAINGPKFNRRLICQNTKLSAQH
jgi:hypothetical protein